MAKGSVIAYQLRPNKTVDRDVFLDFLIHAQVALGVRGARYISLGGPLLEDFRLFGARLGFTDMVCVERDQLCQQRQRLNAPPFVAFANGDINDYLAEAAVGDKVHVIWLDYVDPASESLLQKIGQTCAEIHELSVVKVTFSCHAPQVPQGVSQTEMLREVGRRIEQQLGRYAPADLGARRQWSKRDMANVQLCALRLALEKEARLAGREIVPVTSSVYADQTTMTSALFVVGGAGSKKSLPSTLHMEHWPYYEPNWARPLLIDIPVLSYIERSILEYRLEREQFAQVESETVRAVENADVDAEEAALPPAVGDWSRDARQALRSCEGFDPPGSLGSAQEVMESFRRFHRLFPAFARLHH